MSDALNYPEPLAHSWHRRAREDSRSPDLGLVLVIAASPVNRVVVGRIVECAGLKAIRETPQKAERALLEWRPGTVILDCGADNSECDCFAPAFEQFRLGQGGALPFLILLSTAGVPSGGTLLAGFADATVSKPITIDGLQPVLVQLVESARR